MACAAPALAADHQAATAKATNSQQDKMKMCNAQAGDKKGDERKAFMKTCLSAKPRGAREAGEQDGHVQQEDGRALKDERAKAQSECMKAPLTRNDQQNTAG